MPNTIDLLSRLTDCTELTLDGSTVLAAIHPTIPGMGTLSAPQGGWSSIEAGEEWLKSRGCDRVVGPMEGCSWFAYRANLGPFERKAFAMEPVAEADPWLLSGYRTLATYTSTLQPHESALDRLNHHHHRAQELGVRFRSIDLDRVEEELERCHALTHASFSSAVGYAPIPSGLFVAMYAPLLRSAPADLLLLAESEDEQVLGYCLTFPEPLAPERKEVVVKSLAVHPASQGASVGSALVAEAHQRALSMGFVSGGIHALMRGDSNSQHITARGGAEVIRNYALYEKNLKAS